MYIICTYVCDIHLSNKIYSVEYLHLLYIYAVCYVFILLIGKRIVTGLIKSNIFTLLFRYTIFFNTISKKRKNFTQVIFSLLSFTVHKSLSRAVLKFAINYTSFA